MLHEFVFVAAADLKKVRLPSPGKPYVTVGPETERVIKKAAEVAKSKHRALVCVLAGYTPKYEVWMAEVMRDSLIALGVEKDRIITERARTFDSTGEAAAFSQVLSRFRIGRLEENEFDIELVIRWWHAPRMKRLLWARLGGGSGYSRYATVEVVPVFSLDILGMLREPFAWLKNLRNM